MQATGIGQPEIDAEKNRPKRFLGVLVRISFLEKSRLAHGVCYASKDLKRLANSENPLDPVNRIHHLLKMFLNSHSGFKREDLQGFLKLYAFTINSPVFI